MKASSPGGRTKTSQIQNLNTLKTRETLCLVLCLVWWVSASACLATVACMEADTLTLAVLTKPSSHQTTPQQPLNPDQATEHNEKHNETNGRFSPLVFFSFPSLFLFPPLLSHKLLVASIPTYTWVTIAISTTGKKLNLTNITLRSLGLRLAF